MSTPAQDNSREWDVINHFIGFSRRFLEVEGLGTALRLLSDFPGVLGGSITENVTKTIKNRRTEKRTLSDVFRRNPCVVSCNPMQCKFGKGISARREVEGRSRPDIYCGLRVTEFGAAFRAAMRCLSVGSMDSPWLSARHFCQQGICTGHFKDFLQIVFFNGIRLGGGLHGVLELHSCPLNRVGGFGAGQPLAPTPREQNTSLNHLAPFKLVMLEHALGKSGPRDPYAWDVISLPGCIPGDSAGENGSTDSGTLGNGLLSGDPGEWSSGTGAAMSYATRAVRELWRGFNGALTRPVSGPNIRLFNKFRREFLNSMQAFQSRSYLGSPCPSSSPGLWDLGIWTCDSVSSLCGVGVGGCGCVGGSNEGCGSTSRKNGSGEIVGSWRGHVRLHVATRVSPSPSRHNGVGGAELYYLRHARSCAAVAGGRSGTGGASGGVVAVRAPWVVRVAIRAVLTGLAGWRSATRFGLWALELLLRNPVHGAALWSVSGFGEFRGQSAWWCLGMLAVGVHYRSPTCEALSASAVWDFTKGAPVQFRVMAAVYAGLVAPGFPASSARDEAREERDKTPRRLPQALDRVIGGAIRGGRRLLSGSAERSRTSGSDMPVDEAEADEGDDSVVRNIFRVSTPPPRAPAVDEPAAGRYNVGSSPLGRMLEDSGQDVGIEDARSRILKEDSWCIRPQRRSSSAPPRLGEIVVFTDGSGPASAEVEGSAGWGVVVLEEGMDPLEYCGPVNCHIGERFFFGAIEKTNNTGELSAVIMALKYLLEVDTSERPVCIRPDSKYASDMTQGLKNAHTHHRLVSEAQRLFQEVRAKRRVRFEWIQGHSGNVWNGTADTLAHIGKTGKVQVWGAYGNPWRVHWSGLTGASAQGGTQGAEREAKGTEVGCEREAVQTGSQSSVESDREGGSVGLTQDVQQMAVACGRGEGVEAVASQASGTSSQADHAGLGSQESVFSFGVPVAGANKRDRGTEAGRNVREEQPSSRRKLCPVTNCPCASVSRDCGWTTMESLRKHMDLHLLGELEGKPPVDWMDEHNLTACKVCGFSVSRRVHGGIHPRCWPLWRTQQAVAASGGAGQARDGSGRSGALDRLPSMDDICTAYVQTK